MEKRHWKTGGPCPYVGNPTDECYVVGMSSQSIEQAINYCGNNYEECDIYKRLSNISHDPMRDPMKGREAL